ncbi:MAG TPA: M23 family metallopeptidase [Sandaracinaceae bacterium LLY-WYZ-13_1]|nr:M23 family metallopeptidase [Sandaracinaceae bacterium LLY-WYZ-13_1]
MSRRSQMIRRALGAATLGLGVPAAIFLAAPDAGADQADSGEATEATDPPRFPEQAAEAGCDSAAGREADVEELVADAPRDRTIETPRPTRWRESRGRQCRRYHGRAFCDGPRRVPEPHGPAAERAADLGLDDERRAGRMALNAEPDEAWLEAVEGSQGAGLLWPVPDGRLWRGFGRHRELRRGRNGRVRRGRRRRLHRGVDIGAEEGSPIRAVNDGLVVYSYNGLRGYGNSVVLLHADGTVTLYAHCHATYVFAGQQVRRGQVIGEVGHTGLAHGDHLHFEWRRAGRPRDPGPHFLGRDVDEDAADGARASR